MVEEASLNRNHYIRLSLINLIKIKEETMIFHDLCIITHVGRPMRIRFRFLKIVLDNAISFTTLIYIYCVQWLFELNNIYIHINVLACGGKKGVNIKLSCIKNQGTKRESKFVT